MQGRSQGGSGVTKDEQQLRAQRHGFCRTLATYLAGPTAVEHSIRLATSNPHALLWRDIRGLTPLHGYPTVDEAAEELDKFLVGLYKEDAAPCGHHSSE